MQPDTLEQDPWQGNYFNYFTETEQHFQRTRGTALFLMSPLDWALIEAWKDAGIPLEAVLRGITVAFEKARSRKRKTDMVNSLAYCAQAVVAEAQLMAGTIAPKAQPDAAPPFPLEALRKHLLRGAADLQNKPQPYQEVASTLQRLADEAEQHYSDLEGLEQHLTVLEDKLKAIARSQQSDEDLLAARRDLDSQLRPYRSKMTAEQLSMLERQYLDRRLLETAALPRLSLFYM